jgi:hypothetical protein
MMPCFFVRDSGSDEGVFDERSSHVECVEALSYRGHFARGNGGTQAIHEPAPISIEVGDELLRSGAKYKNRNEPNRHFRYEESGFESDLQTLCNSKADFANACGTNG